MILSPRDRRCAGLIGVVAVLGLLAVAAAPGRSDERPKTEPKTNGDKPAAKSEKKAVQVGPPSGGHQATDLINRELAQFWADNNVRPSVKATDGEFARRAFLDLIGRIPAAWEVANYVRDTSKDRRAKLINRLLNDPYYKEEFDSNWAEIWTTLLLTRSANRTYHDQMADWLAEQFGRNRPWDQIVRDLLTARGKTDENGAVNFILAHLGEPQQNRAEEGQFDMVPITSRAMRLFLGVQVQCNQCHHHPFNPELKQGHFWGINAFFRQVEREGQPNMANQRNQPAAQLTLKDNENYNATQTVYYEDRQAVVRATMPKFLDGKGPPAGKSRREALADFIINYVVVAKNEKDEDVRQEMFARAMVNRLWGHFFGRGLNQEPAVDNFHENNPVVHPGILDGLAKNFKDYKYDLRQLMSWICNSEAYALSCTANPTNAKPEHEPYFARMLLKNMSPEQLFDSLKTALDQPEPVHKERPGVKKKPGATRVVDEARKREREEWLAKLTRNFGDDEGNEITFNGTVVQALLMMNGRELQRELTRADNNTVVNAMKAKTPQGILDELCMVALARPARPAEQKVILANREKLIAGNPVQFWEDVLWAYLNSNEFILNH